METVIAKVPRQVENGTSQRSKSALGSRVSRAAARTLREHLTDSRRIAIGDQT